MTVLIKGTGVAGLTTAFELTRRGIPVVISEILSEIGHGASHYAGGMLAPYCERETADETVLQLGMMAADWWEEALPGSVTRNGTLVVAPTRDRQELARFAAHTRGYHWLEAKEIAEMEPSLEGRFSRALLFPNEAHLDPRAALHGLHEALKAQGVCFHVGGETPSSSAFDIVIDCTGPAAIGSMPGLRGVRGEMLILETSEIALSRPVRLLHPRHPIYLVPRDNHRFMLGATMIETGGDDPITARSMMELLNAAYALHPAFGEARIIETGTGIRPAFSDNIPRLEDTADGFAIAGLYRHGFLLAPALAAAAADRLTGNASDQERMTA